MAGRIAYYGGIVTNGLVLDLDAAKKDSYLGSGTTWRDLSGTTISGSLVNGPTFNSANNGSIVFDGVDDYVVVSSFAQLPVGSSPRTVNIWFNPNTTTWEGNVNNLFFYGSTGINGATFGIDFGNYPVMEVYTWGGTNRDLLFSSSFARTGWANIAVTFNGSTGISIYENGINTQNFTITTPSTGTTSVWIGAINPAFNSWYYDGKISSVQMYNRSLSAQEVLQNYNAQKGRYGL